jgi:hypothetical protein
VADCNLVWMPYQLHHPLHGDEEMQAQAIAEASCYKNRDGVFARDAVFNPLASLPLYKRLRAMPRSVEIR